MIFGFVILTIAVLISAIAAWYSVMGLTAIFAAATLPVIIMGGALEAGKIAATVWLHNNWHRAGWQFKAYLVPAVVFLMFLTSMGIFGFLSKAHLDQAVPTGDAQAQIQIIDEKIVIQQEIITQARKDQTILNNQIDKFNELGAVSKGLTARESQKVERQKIMTAIEAAQNQITRLREQKAPLAAQYRKIEAEVGPIKYLAAMIYGNTTDNNLLEEAVRWVIVMIVVVFDPLALTLILAANKQFEWARQGRGAWRHEEETTPVAEPAEEKPEASVDTAEIEQHKIEQANLTLAEIPTVSQQDYDTLVNELEQERLREAELVRGHDEQKQLVEDLAQELSTMSVELDQLRVEKTQLTDKITTEQATAEELKKLLEQQLVDAQIRLTTAEGQYNQLEQTVNALTSENTDLETQLEQARAEVATLQGYVDQLQIDLRAAIALAQERNETIKQMVTPEPVVVVEPVAVIEPTPIVVVEPEPVVDDTVTDDVTNFDNSKGYEARYFPKVSRPQSDIGDEIPESGNADFGTKFPTQAVKGDLYLRVDFLPPQLYKWNGAKWIQIDRASTDRLAYNQAYIDHLVTKLRSGEYDIEDLNEIERAEIATYLNGNGKL